MVETHPFGNFFPKDSRFLLVGSFATRQFIKGKEVPDYNWFYSTTRNQFWPILRRIYRRELVSRRQKEKLFRDLRLAVTDIIYQCERAKDSNLDVHLKNIIYNDQSIRKFLKTAKIKEIYFSSRFVEDKFRRLFKAYILTHPGVKLVTLPSPSPRFAAMSFEEKVHRYNQLLPKT